MKNETLAKMREVYYSMIDPALECRYQHPTGISREGWIAYMVDKAIREDYVYIVNSCGENLIFPTERSVITACHELGITEVNFQLPV